ncbi:MAG: putative glycoside hydrolase [Dehalococcoidia bacterium]
MRRRRRSGRFWLWPLVLLSFGGVALLVPRFVDALPTGLRGKIVDEYTGQPISGAVIQTADGTVSSREDGRFFPGKGDRLVVEADGYLPREIGIGEIDQVTLRPSVLAGGVVDDDGRPVVGAQISIGTMAVRSGPEGIYRLPNVEAEPVVVVKAPGYAKAVLRPSRVSRLDIRLTRQPIRAVYMSGATLAYDLGREQLLASLAPNGLNAVVIDLKTDRGALSYQSGLPLARTIGASTAGPDLAALLKRLKGQNIYTIGRIVVYRDRVLAQAKPEWAIKDRGRNDAIYTDREGGQWTDPFRREVWEYHAALAEEAAALGFDEVQFDYLRFPIDGTGDHLGYSAPSTAESRQSAIQGFLTLVNERTRPSGLFVSVNVFGYVIWNAGELGYGHDLEHLAGLVDYVSPTLYPSTFGGGIPGLVDRNGAIGNPYELVRRSLVEAKRRLKGDSLRLRPWLQYFDDYAYQTGKRYDAAEIAAQIRATAEEGSSGWMFWDPTNLYSRGGFERRP